MTVEQPPSAVLSCRCKQLLVSFVVGVISFLTHNLRDSRSRYLVLLTAANKEHQGDGCCREGTSSSHRSHQDHTTSARDTIGPSRTVKCSGDISLASRNASDAQVDEAEEETRKRATGESLKR
ncbi:hypothetical protein C4D60_Mb02t10660 [Musa balbisiana]|uniref:Uncharacterized protein n=1 Tax=Musa balbisiana TaxID=52838 RepID=A0A4S8IC31_MUSBA|nr:hypothetical protein C4D60_Mb02t10660 [Musa balbisiana]